MLKREKKRLEKEKAKLEKAKAKSKSKLIKMKNEFNEQLNELSPSMVNLVLSTPNTCPVVTCAYKFKKGKSKGENCQCKKIFKDGLCKFHHRKHVQAMEKKKQQLEKANPNIKIKTIKYNKNQNLVITI